MQHAARIRQRTVMTTVCLAALLACAPRAEAGAYLQTNLVSDIPGLAQFTDPALKNPWGVSESPTSPFWISDQGTNESTLYSLSPAGVVSKPALTVAIPTTAGGPQGPTGQVNNTGTGFVVGGRPANFIFANLNGTISAWNSGLGTAAQVQATTPGTTYTGLAIDAASSRLYAATGSGSGRVDIFDSAFAPVFLPGAFTDPNLPAGLVPFNVQNVGGKIYVTYAPSGRSAQTSATAGQGVVDVFDSNGAFVQRLITGSALAAPWGLALAPSGFGPFGGDLLVGNFSFADSGINAFDPINGALIGAIPIEAGANTPGGLWDLTFGNGGSGGDRNTLYFTDGINGEVDGLFASISAVPEPSTMLLLGAVLALAPVLRRRRP
jgi:uncharacterized protein (TIGR03118 family)